MEKDYFWILFPLIIYIPNLVISIIILLICIFDYKDEDLLINAIEKTWKNYPIFNLSLIPLEGYEEITFMKFEEINNFCDCTHVNKFNKIFNRNCDEYEFFSGCSEYSANEKALKIYNSSIYAKYYEANYMTLFKRIKKHTSGSVCKEEFERCGYLDLNKNTFSIQRGELCPINFNIKFNYGEDGKISGINYIRGDTESYILNRLFASEVENATIFDINKFYISNDEKNNQKKYEGYKFYPLGKLLDYKKIYKNEFYLENSLIKGSIPEYFNSSNIYLVHLIYPANSEEVNLGELALYILKKPNRYIFKAFILFVKIFFFIIEVFLLFIFSFCNNCIFCIIIYIFFKIIISILLLGLSIINIIYIKQKYNLHKLLYYNNITSGSGIATFVFQIFVEIIPELIMTQCVFSTIGLMIKEIKSQKEKKNENNLKNNKYEAKNFDKNNKNKLEDFKVGQIQNLIDDD